MFRLDLYSSSNAKTLYSYIATLAGMMQHTQEANPSEFVRHRFAASKSKLYFIYFAAVLGFIYFLLMLPNAIGNFVYIWLILLGSTILGLIVIIVFLVFIGCMKCIGKEASFSMNDMSLYWMYIYIYQEQSY